jgi:hypothetical protein
MRAPAMRPLKLWVLAVMQVSPGPSMAGETRAVGVRRDHRTCLQQGDQRSDIVEVHLATFRVAHTRRDIAERTVRDRASARNRSAGRPAQRSQIPR